MSMLFRVVTRSGFGAYSSQLSSVRLRCIADGWIFAVKQSTFCVTRREKVSIARWAVAYQRLLQCSA